MKQDVVSLPEARCAGCVHERRELPIDGARLAIGVGLILVRIQHLHLVAVVQEHAAVAAILVLAVRRRGLGELHVQLAVSEALARIELTCSGRHLQVTRAEFPFRGAPVFLSPLREVPSIEKQHGVKRRPILDDKAGDTRLRLPWSTSNIIWQFLGDSAGCDRISAKYWTEHS